MTRIEIANQIAEKVNGKVWAPKEEDGTIRVYVGKRGFCQVENDGVNIDSVGGHDFDNVKSVVESLKIKAYRR